MALGERPDADGRLEAFGNQLKDVHRWLRAELADLRDSVGNERSFPPSNALGVPEWTDAPPDFLLAGADTRPSP